MTLVVLGLSAHTRGRVYAVFAKQAEHLAPHSRFPLECAEVQGKYGEKMISASYLGMPLEISDLDHENLDYFA